MTHLSSDNNFVPSRGLGSVSSLLAVTALHSRMLGQVPGIATQSVRRDSGLAPASAWWSSDGCPTLGRLLLYSCLLARVQNNEQNETVSLLLAFL